MGVVAQCTAVYNEYLLRKLLYDLSSSTYTTGTPRVRTKCTYGLRHAHLFAMYRYISAPQFVITELVSPEDEASTWTLGIKDVDGWG